MKKGFLQPSVALKNLKVLSILSALPPKLTANRQPGRIRTALVTRVTRFLRSASPPNGWSHFLVLKKEGPGHTRCVRRALLVARWPKVRSALIVEDPGGDPDLALRDTVPAARSVVDVASQVGIRVARVERVREIARCDVRVVVPMRGALFEDRLCRLSPRSDLVLMEYFLASQLRPQRD